MVIILYVNVLRQIMYQFLLIKKIIQIISFVFSSSVRSLRSIPPVSCMQGYQQPPQATPVHPSIQAIHTVLPPPQQPNVFSRPEVITSRRIGPTAVIVS